MSALFLLLGASLLIAGGFLIAFILSAKSGQFDDDFTPSIRMLSDDPVPEPEPESSKPENQENV